MIRRPPRSTRTDTPFPYTTLFRSLRSLEKIAFGMSDRGGISAADDIEEHILQHVVEIGGRHAPPEIFPEQGKVRPEGFDQVGVGLTCGQDRKSTRLNSSH